MIRSGLMFWLKLERSKAQRLLNFYELGIDRVSCSRLGRTPVDITQSEIERLRKTITDLSNFINRGFD